MGKYLFKTLPGVCLAAAASLGSTAIHADVTVEQKTTLDVASIIKTHGSSTTNITADKKREDTESHCEGMMSLVCGNVRSGEIVRLDRGVTWRLHPDKKSYAEEAFATPEQLADMRAKMQAQLEKMRSCPVVQQQQQPIDKSKCEMSAPKIDVHKTDDKMSIAGHDTQRTLSTLTESCTNKDTGDVCDTVIAVDSWLTQDDVPGASDRRAFQQAYAKKLGLLDEQGAMTSEVAKFLAPYQTQIKQLTDKSGDLKGQPLKTTLRVMMGGPQCSAAAKIQTNGSAAGSSSPAGSSNPIDSVAQASKAIGSSVGNFVSMFHKKKPDAAAPASGGAAPGDANAGADAATAAAGAAGAAAAPGAADPFAKYVQVATFTSETVSINANAVPADRFDVPADWKKEAPKAAKQGNDEFTCPKSGG